MENNNEREIESVLDKMRSLLECANEAREEAGGKRAIEADIDSLMRELDKAVNASESDEPFMHSQFGIRTQLTGAGLLVLFPKRLFADVSKILDRGMHIRLVADSSPGTPSSRAWVEENGMLSLEISESCMPYVFDDARRPRVQIHYFEDGSSD